MVLISLNNLYRYPRRKIDIMRKKLIGIHCSTIMIEELAETKHKREKFFPLLKEVIEGRRV